MSTTTESYLTTYQLARLLGTSRSTILRYEDAGLLEPADVADDANASRLYDCHAAMKLKMFLFHKRIHTDTLTTYKDLSEFTDIERCVAKLRDKRNLIDKELRKLIALSDNTESIHDVPWECPPGFIFACVVGQEERKQ